MGWIRISGVMRKYWKHWKRWYILRSSRGRMKRQRTKERPRSSHIDVQNEAIQYLWDFGFVFCFLFFCVRQSCKVQNIWPKNELVKYFEGCRVIRAVALFGSTRLQ